MATDNLIGVLTMIKNESASIAETLESVKSITKHIIVYDTGSTDNTIDIIKKTCKKCGFKLHLKQGTFTNFPNSRNESLKFAETVDVKYLLMMDAGDIFKTTTPINELKKIVQKLPRNLALVRHQWRHEKNTDDHVDIRFIRNKLGLRYHPDFPVHERFDTDDSQVADISSIITLYQDRVVHGGSTEKRYTRDLELLLNAPKNRRNYYFLAQTYMCMNDFEKGFEYNVKTIECEDRETNDITFSYVRAGYCALMCNMPKSVIFKYLNKAIEQDKPIDCYIYIMKYCIDHNEFDEAYSYVRDMVALVKPEVGVGKLVNHTFYDYLRWHFASIICFKLMKLVEGLEYCKKAAANAPPDSPGDKQNLETFGRLVESGITPDEIFFEDGATKDGATKNVATKTPAIIQKTPGKQTIIYYCAEESAYFDPSDQTLGNSEISVIELSAQWQQMGYDVHVFANTKPQTYRNVQYHHSTQFNQSVHYNIFIFWRAVATKNLNHIEWVLHGPRRKETAVFLDMHDYSPPHQSFYNFEKDSKSIDAIIVKSEYHKQLFKGIFTGHIVVIPNGVLIDEFAKVQPQKRDPLRFCYISMWERGLYYILDGWDYITKYVPGASLHIYSDCVYIDKKLKHQLYEKLDAAILRCRNIYVHGRLAKKDVYTELKKSSYLYYFTDSPIETDCVSIREADELGCIPILSNKNVFKERRGAHFGGSIVNAQIDVAKQIVYKLLSGSVLQTNDGTQYLEQGFSWNKSANKWKTLFNDNLT